MNVRIISLASVLAVVSLTGCEGLRDALTAHTETAARAERHELTATRLAELIAPSQAPLQPDIVRALAEIWVNYQLLGVAASRGDSLNDPALADSAMWAMVASSKARQFYDRVSRGWGAVDTAAAPEAYRRADMLAAQHILLLTQNQPDSVKRAKLARIQALRGRANSANFAELARANSEDQGSARRGGSLGVFPRGTMVPEFEQALVGLEPGAISGIVETQFGYHIIRRPTYPEVEQEFLDFSGRMSMAKAESIYTARMDTESKITVRGNAVAKARSAVRDVDRYRSDRTVIASSTAGPFTTARLVRWIETFPPQQQIARRLQDAPDTAVEQLIRNFVRNELVIRAADSAGIRVAEDTLGMIRRAFGAQVLQAWAQLGVEPAKLADSARTQAEREEVASRRVDAYLQAMLAERVPFVPVAPQMQWALRSRYKGSINAAGLDRAVQIAQRLRGADTSRQQPPSAVPLPPGGDQGGSPPPPSGDNQGGPAPPPSGEEQGGSAPPPAGETQR